MSTTTSYHNDENLLPPSLQRFSSGSTTGQDKILVPSRRRTVAVMKHHNLSNNKSNNDLTRFPPMPTPCGVRTISLDMSQKSETMEDGSCRSRRASNADVRPSTPRRQTSNCSGEREADDDEEEEEEEEDDDNNNNNNNKEIPSPRSPDSVHMSLLSLQRQTTGVSISKTTGNLVFIAQGPPRAPGKPLLWPLYSLHISLLITYNNQ